MLLTVPGKEWPPTNKGGAITLSIGGGPTFF